MNDRDEAAAADWDSPWKEVLAAFLPDAIALFLPETHALIDWLRPYELLDKELQQITPDGVAGRRVVDLLARVWRRAGGRRGCCSTSKCKGSGRPTSPSGCSPITIACSTSSIRT